MASLNANLANHKQEMLKKEQARESAINIFNMQPIANQYIINKRTLVTANETQT